MKKTILVLSGLTLLTFGSLVNPVSTQAAEVKVSEITTTFLNDNQIEVSPSSYTVAPNYIYYEAQVHTSQGLTPTKYFEWSQYGHKYRGYLTYQFTYPNIYYYKYAGTLYRDDYNGGIIPMPSKVVVPE